MKRARPWFVLAPAVGCALLAIALALSDLSVRATAAAIALPLLANFILYADALDFLLRRLVHWQHTGGAGRSRAAGDQSLDVQALLGTGAQGPARPYAIVASIYNLESRLNDFIEAMQAHRDRVWLVSDGSSDATVQRLRAAGWRCLDERINRRKPGALRALLPQLPPEIETVMVIDPDIRICSTSQGSEVSLERFVSDFQRSGAAAVCPRLRIEPHGVISRFQALEYVLAFRVGRASLADCSVTSGIAFYRRDALVRALEVHSLSVYGEDLENALILLGQSERIYYDGRLVIATDGPATWRRWFSQRVGWYHGLARAYTRRFAEVRRISHRGTFQAYQFLIYLGVISLGLQLFRVACLALLLVNLTVTLMELLNHGWVFTGLTSSQAQLLSVLGGQLVLTLVVQLRLVPKAERAYTAPIVPVYVFYSMLHVVPTSLGLLNWIAVTLWGRRLYRDYFMREEDLPAGVFGRRRARSPDDATQAGQQRSP